MATSIDVLARRGMKYRRRARGRVNLLIIAVVIFVVGLFASASTAAPFGRLYSRTQAGATNETLLYGAPVDLEIVSDGSIWALTWANNTICVVDREKPQVFWRGDVSSRARDLWSFTRTGDAIWVNFQRGVARYDGTQWQEFRYPDEVGYTDNIVAGSYGVMVGAYGKLIHLKNQVWEISQLSDLLPGLSESEPTYPKMIADENRVWMLYYGLWFYSEGTWRLIEATNGAENEYYWPLTITGDSLWYTTPIGLRQTALNGVSRDIPFELTGLPAGTRILDGEVQNGVLYLATDAGIIYQNGNGWESLLIPSLTPNETVWDVTFAADGTLWAAVSHRDVRTESFQSNYSLRYLLGVFAPLASIITGIGFVLFPYLFSSVQRGRDARVKLDQLLPDLPRIQPLFANRRIVWEWLIGFAVVIGAGFLFVRANLPLSLTMALNFILAIMVYALPMWRRRRQADGESRPLIQKVAVYYTAITATACTALLAAVVLLDAVGRSLGIVPGIVSYITFAGGLIAAGAVFGGTQIFPTLAIYRGPLRHGDYDAALVQIERFRILMPSISSLFLRGYVLSLAGRFAEAETVWRRGLTESHSSGVYVIAVILANLGESLKRQGKHDEARPLLKAALEMLPENPALYRELAEDNLERGINTDETLILTTAMMQFSSKPRFNIALARHQWASALAMHAWAMAMNSDLDGAKRALKRAVRDDDKHFKPGLAWLQYLAGQIAFISGDNQKARQHFNQAVSLDPQGATGTLAQQAALEMT
jgi:tetratricopeptide (TPR) repeat protein